MDERTRREVDWSTAEIDGGALRVCLVGPASRGWQERFERVLGLLEPNGGDWGELALKKGVIKVADVHEGCEADLRHFLESVMLEVNAHFAPKHNAAAAQDDAQQAPEERMVATFRSFAPQDATEDSGLAP